MTPEGKIKQQVNRIIDRYKGIYKHMPVPVGYGTQTLDYLLCVNGHFLAIETKAPGKKPTPRQRDTIERMERAGGIVLVIDGPDGLAKLTQVLEALTHAPCPGIPTT